MPIHPVTSSFMPSPRTTRSPREVVVRASSEGAILAAIALLISRTIRGKIVDYFGTGIPGATVIARYHEPYNRIPRVLRDESSSSNESGEFVLCNVGLDVASCVDSLAPSHPPSHSTLLALEADKTGIGRIGPREPQATFVVKVVDRSGQPVAGVPTFLCVETSHFIPCARSSWLIRQGLTESLLASRFGSARFHWRPTRSVHNRSESSNDQLGMSSGYGRDSRSVPNAGGSAMTVQLATRVSTLLARRVFATGLLVLSGLVCPATAMAHEDAWTQVERLTPGVPVRVCVFAADLASGRKCFRGQFESSGSDSITLRLSDRHGRTFRRSLIRKVGKRRPISKRYAGWIAVGATVAVTWLFSAGNSDRPYPGIYVPGAGSAALGFWRQRWREIYRAPTASLRTDKKWGLHRILDKSA